MNAQLLKFFVIGVMGLLFNVSKRCQYCLSVKQESFAYEPDTLFNTLYTDAQCFPLVSLLTALNVTHVDFFVLDVEKVEEQVLQTFPFDTVTVDVWVIEHITIYEDTNFVKFMISKGYYYFDILCAEVSDYIFVRKNSSLYSRLSVPLHEENRELICPFKRHIGTNNTFSLDDEALRDSHHYPELQYKSAPLISPTEPDGSFLLFKRMYIS